MTTISLPSLPLSQRATSACMVVLLALGGSTLTGTPAQAADAGATSWAWGDNTYGQAEVPASLDAKTVTAIAGGIVHSLALTSDGHVTAWGFDGAGQTTVPASLAGRTVTAVSAGRGQSLALTDDGTVTAWGADNEGESTVPGSLTGRNVTAISAGEYHNLALTDDGMVTAWGFDGMGQSSVPGSLTGRTVTAVAAGGFHSLALTSDGQVTAWGYNYMGQTDVPASLTGKTVTAIAGGGYHSLALTSDGQVTAWGHNGNGQSAVPASLTGKTVTAIGGGQNHSLALTSDGQLTAWGADDLNQSTVPTGLTGKTVTAMSAGGYHNLAIVSPSAFTTGTTASIAGTAMVGRVLTAGAGAVAPAPDSFTYRWFADAAVVDGATSATFRPTAAEQGAVITVEVTASRGGYQDSSDLSAPTGKVAGPRVTTGKAVGIDLAKRTVKVRHRQWVTISGLADGERVIVRYRGRRISADNASANNAGRYRTIFYVGKRPGLRHLRATGEFGGRAARTAFRVTRR